MKRTGVVLAIALLSGAACGGMVRPGTDGGEPQPLPSPTAPYRAEGLPDGRERIWPNSARVELRVPYRVTVYTHCGVDHALDFDGSFWKVSRKSDKERARYDDPDDTGVITLVDEDTATYRTSRGDTVTLTRLEGPKDMFLCE